MKFLILNDMQKHHFRDDIIKMMQVSDKDFVPPLSSRTSPLQRDLSVGESHMNGIMSYCEEMNRQKILGAIDGDELLGFVSFRENFTNDVINEDDLPNIYISTLILKPEARGKRLTARMYEYLFNELYSGVGVFTRTWSTNIAHIKILSRFDFCELCRKVNERGHGIDTVYYKKF